MGSLESNCIYFATRSYPSYGFVVSPRDAILLSTPAQQSLGLQRSDSKTDIRDARRPDVNSAPELTRSWKKNNKNKVTGVLNSASDGALDRGTIIQPPRAIVPMAAWLAYGRQLSYVRCRRSDKIVRT